MRDDKNLPIGNTDESRLGINVGYGFALNSFDLGASVNIEHQSLAGYSSTSSPGLNIAASRIFRFQSSHISDFAVGVYGRNILRPSIKLAEHSYKYPYALNAGVKLTLVPSSDWNHKAHLYAAACKTDQVDPTLAAGIELAIANIIDLRGGISGDNFATGIGIRHQLIGFDYVFIERDLDNLHLFSVSLSFGKSVEERRLARESKREEEFNSYLSQQLGQRNQEMISSLVSAGKRSLADRKVETAHEKFDKALFLARAAGSDTLEIVRLIDSTAAMIRYVEMEAIYKAHLDSAQSKYDSGDHLGARYFAEKALELKPGSRNPLRILQKADSVLSVRHLTSYLVEQRLIEVDSLLDYGKPVEAVEALQTISEYADSMPQISQALRRATFEIIQEKSVLAFGSGDLGEAQALVDSASAIYADHPWCLEMKKRISRERSHKNASNQQKKSVIETPVSDELLSAADAAYNEGKELFESGDLANAIGKWENVERMAPNHKSVRSYLTKAYKYLGVELYGQSRLEEAIAIWKKASLLDPDSEEIADYIRRTETEIRKLKELSYDH
jgi:tetratricopeptide (TPR) repeat protein